MAVLPVEWVLVVYYGPSAHRATYGRLDNTRYTKDYIQLSRREDFLNALESLFSESGSSAGSVPLTYRWPTGSTPGALVFQSADRPHLKWETSRGAPRAWKMLAEPSESSAETIPGDPTHRDFESAEREFELLGHRGAGQPYLLAIKLRSEDAVLHLRAYLANPSKKFTWADIKYTPRVIRELADSTSQNSALAWCIFQGGGTVPDSGTEEVVRKLFASEEPALVIDALSKEEGRELKEYLMSPGHGLFFDPDKNHDAWMELEPLLGDATHSVGGFIGMLEARYSAFVQEDAIAESMDVSAEEIEAFRGQVEDGDYEVLDSHATIKTRGSAQKVFAEAVKKNYGFRCAITGIETHDFLIASHIVPWSKDHSIRLDPSNGICLSLLVDRAFEIGYLVIEDDLTIRIRWSWVGGDESLRSLLEQYDGKKLNVPVEGGPNPVYLRRRRELVDVTEL